MNAPHSPTFQTLDLAISNMDTHSREEQVATALKGMRGVRDVTLIERGATVHYDSNVVTKGQIMNQIRSAGFKASLFQDTATGETGTVDF